MKTCNGTLASHEGQTMLIGTNGGRTAHVSAVPRSNKLKVSGGTQTCTADLQMKIPPNTQHRSFSLTGPTAAQLSQSIRERFSNGSHSLPKPGSDLSVFQQRYVLNQSFDEQQYIIEFVFFFFLNRMANRASMNKMKDGNLSDTQTYAEVKTDYGSYTMWLKHSNTASSRLSEVDSVENSPARGGHKLLTKETMYAHSPRLNRSNSIR